MQLVLKSTGNELMKLFARNKYKVLLVLETILSCAVIIFASKINFSQYDFLIRFPNMPYSILSVLYTIVLPLTIFMLITDLFSHEFEDFSIKSVLLRPISRFKVFVSKLMAISLYIAFNLIIICIASIIAKLIIGDYVDVFSLVISYVITIVPMLAFITFSALIAQMIHNSSMVMFASTIAYFMLWGVNLVFPKIGAVFFTAHLGFYKMCIGNINFPVVLNTFCLFASYIVLLSIPSIILFEKKEI